MTIAQLIMYHIDAEGGTCTYQEIREFIALDVDRDVPDFELDRIINTLIKNNALDFAGEGLKIALLDSTELAENNRFNLSIQAKRVQV
jgi:hypothetical protein